MRNLWMALLLFAAGGMRAQDIVAYEYWFDQNDVSPTSVDITGAQEINLNENIDVSTVAIGHHTMRYRLMDSNGRWSSVQSKPFTRLEGSPYEITGGEYWFDESTTRTPFSIGPGQAVNALIDPAVSGLLQGAHEAHYRLHDNHRFWSGVLSKSFSIQPGSPHELVLLRYWSDQTLQTSDMTLVPITPPVQYLDIIDDVLFCNWSTTGQTNVYFQVKDNHAQWSSVITRNYNVAGSTDEPGPPGAISGNITPPFGSSQTYTIDAIPGAAGYEWTTPIGWTGNSNSTSITVQVGNTNDAWEICVSAYNGCGESAPTCLDITTGFAPNAAQGGIALFPNPTTGPFTITSDATGPVDVTLYAGTGQQVGGTRHFRASEKITVDPGDLAPGAYIVVVATGQRTARMPLLIQR